MAVVAQWAHSKRVAAADAIAPSRALIAAMFKKWSVHLGPDLQPRLEVSRRLPGIRPDLDLSLQVSVKPLRRNGRA